MLNVKKRSLCVLLVMGLFTLLIVPMIFVTSVSAQASSCGFYELNAANDITSYVDGEGFSMDVAEKYSSEIDYINTIVKVSDIDEYNQILREKTGTEEVDLVEIPRAVAFLNINGSRMVLKITSDQVLSNEEMLIKSKKAYCDNLSLPNAETAAIQNFASSTATTLPGHGYSGYGFNFGTEWKTYGQWATTTYTLNGKPSLFVGAKDLCYIYEQTMTLYCQSQYGGEYYCQLQILNIVWADSSMSGVSLNYTNTKYYDNIYPCTYDDYAPKATVGNSNVSYGVSYGVNSEGIITFGISGSMSQSKSDCNVTDNSNKFNGVVSLFYEFGGTYAKSTIYLNSFVVAKKSSNNTTDNVGMHRAVSLICKSSNLFGNTWNWSVFSKANILFKPNVI